MKQWKKPELTNLGVENTKDTRNFPHYWACKGCGKHYVGILVAPNGPCERCGSTDGYEWTIGNGNIVTLPNFDDSAFDQIVSPS